MNINDVLIQPILTEKSNQLKSEGFYVFWVSMFTNKVEVLKAVKKLFDVEVVSCNIHIRKPKYKMLRTRRGYGKSIKKKIAVVKLKEGFKIEELEQ